MSNNPGFMTIKALFIAFVFMGALMAPYQYCVGQESSSDSSVIAAFGNRLVKDIKKDKVV